MCWRHAHAPGLDPDWRLIANAPMLPADKECLVFRVRAKPSKGMRWFFAGGYSAGGKIEIPFDAGLIESIPENMFAQYLKLLTR